MGEYSPTYSSNSIKMYKLTSYTTNDTSNIELDLCKSMLRNSLSTTITNSDNLSSITQNNHLFLSNFEASLSSSNVSALAAFHIEDTAVNLSNTNLNFTLTAPIGNIGPSNSPLNQSISVEEESASFYASSIKISNNNSEYIFSDSNNIFNVSFNNSDSNFNAQKAVNSNLSNIRDFYPLKISESDSFNQQHSLLTQKIITRDATTNQLLASINDITSSFTNIKINGSEENLYTLSNILETENLNTFLGSVKIVQEVGTLSGSGTASTVANLTLTNDTLQLLTTSFTEDRFRNLFPLADRQKVTDSYELSIENSGSATGGYSLSDLGVTLDDSNLLRNNSYMETCSNAGNFFENAIHTVEIDNGYITQTSTNSSHNSPIIGWGDNIETLSINNYTDQLSVKSYFTEINTSTQSSYPRATLTTDNSNNKFTNLAVYYHQSEPSIPLGGSILESVRTSTYKDEFIVTTTLSTSLDSGAYNPDNLIGVSNDVVALLVNDYAGANIASDYTFQAYPELVDLVPENNVLTMTLTNNSRLTNEYGGMRDNNGNIVNGASVNVIGENFDFESLGTTQLQVRVNTKNLDSLSFSGENMLTNGWTPVLTDPNNVLSCGKNSDNILGNNIYALFDEEITDSFEVIVSLNTNGSSINRDTLSTYATITLNLASGQSISKTINESDLDIQILNNQTSITTSNIPYSVGSQDIGIQSTMSYYKLNKVSTIIDCIATIPLSIGGYKNLGVESSSIQITDTYYVLVDNNNKQLPDHYLKYVNQTNNNSNSALRTITGTYSTTFDFLHKDLYSAEAQAYKEISENTWVTASNKKDCDIVFNNLTTLVLDNNYGTIKLTVDTTVSVQLILSGTYNIHLVTDRSNLNYTVIARLHNIDNNFVKLSEWDVYSSSLPTEGTSIDNLTTTVENIFTLLNGESTIQVTISLANSTDPLLVFNTNGTNATSNFNIIYNPCTLFSVSETLGTNTTVYYRKASEGLLEIFPGAYLEYETSTKVGDNSSYSLNGDYLEIKPYSGYTGNYSSVMEVNVLNGLTVTNSVTGSFNIPKYRGNSVKGSSQTGLFEEFLWDRAPSQINFKLSILGQAQVGQAQLVSNLYSSVKTPLYNESIHTVSLSILGNLGIRLNGLYSKYQGSDKTIGVNVSHGSYKISIAGASSDNDIPRIVKNVSELVISTSSYILLNYNGSEPLKIVASRVKVGSNENYFITTGSSSLKVYTSSTFIGDPVTYSTWVLRQTISQQDLTSGDNLYIKHPTLTSNNSQIGFVRNSLAYVSHIGFIVCPPPQLKVSALPTTSEKKFPFNASEADLKIRYVDYNPSSTNYNPMLGIPGVNNFQFSYNTRPKYTKLRINPSSTLNNIRIRSNKILIELYSNYSTNNPNKFSTIYTGYIDDLSTVLTNNVVGVKNTYYNTIVNSNTLSREFSFTQDISVMNPAQTESSIFGSPGTGALNISISGIIAFMNVASPQSLDLLVGDSIQTKYYNSKIKKNASNDTIIEFNKYSGVTGSSELTNSLSPSKFRMFAINRYTSTYVIRSGSSNTLTSVPYNLINDSIAASNDLNFQLSWVQDNAWEAKNLNVEFTATSTEGTKTLSSLMSVYKGKPANFLVIYEHPLVHIVNAAGVTNYKVTNSGALLSASVNSYSLSLNPKGIYNGNIADVLSDAVFE